MTSAEVSMLRAEIVARLDKIELGLFGDDGMGGLAALVRDHLAAHQAERQAQEQLSAAAQASQARLRDVTPSGWARRVLKAIRDYWPLVLMFLGLLAWIVNHVTIILNQ